MLNLNIQKHLIAMNKIPSVRYKYISEFVYKLLRDNNITSYPISIPSLISKLNACGYNITLDTYSSYLSFKNAIQSKRNLPPLKYKDIEDIFGSPDGATARINGTTLNIIFYNDKEPVFGRINWTQAHELGHIMLKHHDIMEPIIIERRGTNHINNQYDILEMEADWFARTLLCHPYVLDTNKIKTWDVIMTVCNISYRAATNRESDIIHKHYYVNKPWDENILSLISINRHCTNCNNVISDVQYVFCPICGSKNTLKWGEGTKMKYKEHELNENGFLHSCIRCHSENIIGNFCHICGAPTRNFCSDYFYNDADYQTCRRSEPLPGNARFCFECGSESLFTRHNLLCTWQEELKKVEEQEELEAQIGFMSIPDGADEPIDSQSSGDIFSIPPFDDIDPELPFN